MSEHDPLGVPRALPTARQRSLTLQSWRLLRGISLAQGKPFTLSLPDVESFVTHLEATVEEIRAERRAQTGTGEP